MDDGTQTLPLCTNSNSTNDKAQYGFNPSQIQSQIGRESKAPAKVLIGWGKGTCNIGQVAPVGPKKSRWLPYLLSGQSGAVEGQDPFQTLAQAPVQDQGQDKGPDTAQAPSLNKTTSSPSLPLPTTIQASTPAVNGTPTPTAVELYTSSPDHLTNTTVATKDLPLDLKNDGNQLFTLLDSSKKDKIYFPLKETPPTPAPTSVEFPAHTQEQEVAKIQVPQEQSEDPIKKYLVHASRLDTSTSAAEPLVALKTQSSSHKISNSQADKQSPSACNNCSNVPLPANQGVHNKQTLPQTPREAMQIPISSAPTCQLQDAVEDHVLVFDIATGSTRMGLLCHDPMGSRAVLVGLTPNHPSTHISENMLSARPLPRSIISPNSDHPSLWSTTATLASPVPSSVSGASYPEVTLVSKEASHNLQLQNSSGTETPIRIRMLARPAVPETPLQYGEQIPVQVPDPSWSKSGAEKIDSSHTIWILDNPRVQDSPKVQTRKLQWIKPNTASTADTQSVPRSLLQEEVGSNNQKEVNSAQPSGPQAENTGQAFLTGQCFLNGQNLLARQLPVAEQGSPSGQPPLTSPPHLREQSLLSRQLSLNRQVPLTVKSPTTNEPTFTSGESVQPSTQESKSLGNPTHVGILRVPLAPEKACIYVNRDKVGNNSAQRSSIHPLPSWQPSDSHRAHQEQLSLITFTGCKDLPISMVGPESQSGHQFKLAPEDMTRTPAVAHLGLLHGNCYELVHTMDALPVQSPVLCHHSSSPYQKMAAIVIDTGTGFTKCGLAGEDHVLSVVPSQVQMLKHPAQGQPQYVVPEQQEGSYSVLNRGVVSDWDALEVLWQHLFYCKLRVQPEEMAVLVADSPISPRTNREKVAEILFERFHVPAMQTVHQALLTLYAYGRTTGLVVGSGHGTSYVAPILTGDLAPLDTYRLDVAGADLTDYLAQLLLAGSHSPPKAELVRQIKEACCYVAMDMAAEMARNQSKAQVEFVLPDKQVITLGSERFCCPEALFQPKLLGLNQPGLPQLALLSISRLEAKQQEQLLANVVLEGGSTLMNGFPERLRQELGPGATVLGSPHRAVAAWLGGSIMACRNSFQSLWLSRREYEEEGPWAIYKYQL
ncbi:hypothetical protein A6R68_00161 [Neotoma lepida]|uniref:Actin-like protein 7B n=1 Tax=Neotoma lepida TaxID=56216 RepID=A0A1A6GYD0_NEOLE|nr:hypothetical protein A6R68_00161 [Neotoma lepida]